MKTLLQWVFVLACTAIAVPALAQAPNLTGRVLSPSRNPVSGVEVRIDGTDIRTRTDDNGVFTFENAPKGTQTLLFRRIGYLPTRVTVQVPVGADPPTVTMVPAPTGLDTVTISAELNVLAGVVIDSAGQPVPGAIVELMGTGQGSRITDAKGWFTFTSVRGGPVVFRARKMGYAPTLMSVRLDEWRGVVLRLSPLPATLAASKIKDRSGFGSSSIFTWNETQGRLAQRGGRAIIVPQEELGVFGSIPLIQALMQARSASSVAYDLQNANNENQVCVVLDGHRGMGTMALDGMQADEVDFVELYPPGTEWSGSLARYVKGMGCQNLRTTATTRLEPFYAVIWMRARKP